MPKQATALTDTAIRCLKPRASQYEVFDPKERSFGVRVSPGGAISFVLFYRFNGRNRRWTMGRYPVLTLAEARIRAREGHSQIASGIDPASKQKASRYPSDDVMFPSIVKKYVNEHAQPNNRSWKQSQDILMRHFEPRWRHHQVAQISKPMVLNAVRQIGVSKGYAAANRAFAEGRSLFNWCLAHDIVDLSPFAGLQMPYKSKSRERVLSDDEIAALWGASESLGYPFGPFVRMLFLTGQRRTEVASMRWSDICLKSQRWTQSFNKSSRTNVIPLSDRAVQELEALPHLDDCWVFPARGKSRPMSGFSKWKARLDQGSGVGDWTLHDIRRTFATGLASLKVAIPTIELILNHSPRSLGGVVQVYNRYDYFDERRDAVQLWANHIRCLEVR